MCQITDDETPVYPIHSEAVILCAKVMYPTVHIVDMVIVSTMVAIANREYMEA